MKIVKQIELIGVRDIGQVSVWWSMSDDSFVVEVKRLLEGC